VRALAEDLEDQRKALESVMDMVEQSATVDQTAKLVREHCKSYIGGTEASEEAPRAEPQSGAQLEARITFMVEVLSGPSKPSGGPSCHRARRCARAAQPVSCSRPRRGRC
jgi:hypothetical protein